MHHTLIVARMAPGAAPDVAKLFAQSDAGELPHRVGVVRRTLFHFHDLYMHLIESEVPPGPEIQKATQTPAFRSITDDLSAYISAYDPATWRSPKDAMAQEFYRWERDGKA
ncbi:TcmI family type II polyketide cyclase [Streptomyces odontomachi]|uniref:TcmI family type II polyketide cyclase n=1 Tax=Streptomyces odontomachi TaxID=2944940 RepID=UPI002109DC17|nr:TcmI family type II polyketide cyclase [Streptomyces sp. ODS25]